MHYESNGFTFSYVLFIISVILFVIGVIFAVWSFSLDQSEDHHHDKEQRRDRRDRRDTVDKFRIGALFFLGAISLTLISMYMGARGASQYAMQHNLLGAKM